MGDLAGANRASTVYLIDASIYIFRAWHSLPDTLLGEGGQPINAVYGFTKFITEFLERSRAEYVAVAFDESLSHSFRNDLYPPYKMNRELPPADLKAQFRLCRAVAEAAGLYCVAHDRYEADDLIATLSLGLREHGLRSAIVTGDKDLAQLLQGDDFWWDFARGVQRDAAKAEEKFGVAPEKMQDYLGLCGDAVDNIPGVPGIGPKTAAELLSRFDSIEVLYENLEKLRYLQIRGAKTLAAKLQPHFEQAMLSKQLATVAYDAPIDFTVECVKRRAPERGRFQELQQILGGRGGGLFERILACA